jgi:uncharacterized membrane protein
MTTVALTGAQRSAGKVAAASWLALLALAVLWEWQLAPLRPGGSWLILKAVPLLVPLRGIWRGAPYALQWALLLAPLYFCEGVVRTFDAAPIGRLAWIELALALAFFVAAIVYLRPFKRAARQAEKA